MSLSSKTYAPEPSSGVSVDAFIYARASNRMTQEQFNQVVAAITNGKYSWACVLVLRFANYNPLHYIPYRTYQRLIRAHGGNHAGPTPDSIAEVCPASD